MLLFNEVRRYRLWHVRSLGNSTFVILPLCTFALWFLFLHSVNVQHMTDLGLVSVLPVPIIIAPVILTMSFCLTMQQYKLREPILLLHLFLLIFMLYSITTLVEEAPRFAIVYRHAGYTEYILRTGTVNPDLDAYFNWPGFFILSAFLTRVAGYQTILSYAAWAPLFFNLIYLGPLYMIFTSATTDKRLIWLGLWFFYLTNWIAQDYFSPQGLNFFFYLVIIAILVKWFKAPPTARPPISKQRWRHLGRLSLPAQRFYAWLTAPDMTRSSLQAKQRLLLLVVLVIIFAFVVFSHPLTPFFALSSVTALVIFRRCTPRWLPILMAIMTAAWIIFMAQAYLAGHLSLVTGYLGNVSDAVTENIANRLEGSPGHVLIARMRIIMTACICGLAFVGAMRRIFTGHRDATYILLAIAPLPLFVAQPYGGEMLLRIYLFSLPMLAFFAAALFYTRTNLATSHWVLAAVLGSSIILLGGFFFTRYGNERMDYMTNAEVAGVRHLYSIAPPDSLLLAGWDGTPWQFQDFEKYSLYSMTDVLPDAVATSNVDAIVQFIESQRPPHAYLIFTRSQKATADSAGLPPGTLDRLEDALLKSGKFKMMYRNPDAQIFAYST